MRSGDTARTRIRNFRAVGRQDVRAAVEIADRAYLLDGGRVIHEGSAAELCMEEERVRRLAGASGTDWD